MFSYFYEMTSGTKYASVPAISSGEKRQPTAEGVPKSMKHESVRQPSIVPESTVWTKRGWRMKS